MARRVAFCLVENKSGQVLLVQRGYGKEKYKWSLPGGHVDHKERSWHAAVRETREETGLKVKIISTVMVGRTNPIETFYGIIEGGRLSAKRPECLDARFFDYDRLPQLAFNADQRAIADWRKMKTDHSRLAGGFAPDLCPHCDSSKIVLRQYPHKNSYRCQSCKGTLQSSTRPGMMEYKNPSQVGGNEDWEHIGHESYSGRDMSQVPDWVIASLSKLDLHHAASRSFYQLVGRNFRYIVAPSGQGAPIVDIYRKKRPARIGDVSNSGYNTPSHSPNVDKNLEDLLGPVWQYPDGDGFD